MTVSSINFIVLILRTNNLSQSFGSQLIKSYYTELSLVNLSIHAQLLKLSSPTVTNKQFSAHLPQAQLCSSNDPVKW